MIIVSIAPFLEYPIKISVTYNAQKQTLLLSGDIELNPGPLTDNTIKDMCFYSNPDFTLRYRMLRHELTPLDVGGGGDCFLNRYHMSFMVIQIIMQKLEH